MSAEIRVVCSGVGFVRNPPPKLVLLVTRDEKEKTTEDAPAADRTEPVDPNG